MNKTVAAVLTTIFLIGGATALLIDDSYADTENEIQIVRNGNDVVLSLFEPGESVTWDLGDGRVVTGASVQTSFLSGSWLIKAIISPTEHIERVINVFDATPPTTAEIGIEYRYGVYAESTDLIVLDPSGSETTWLSYNPDENVLSGVPTITGSHFVLFNGQQWRIEVSETGATAPMKVKFSATVDETTITASPSASYDSTSRFSWSLRDLNGNLIGAHEGRNLVMDAELGYYILSLQQINISGSASYSQIVHVSGTPADGVSSDEQNILPIATGAVAIISLAIATRYRNPPIALIGIASSIITIITVI